MNTPPIPRVARRVALATAAGTTALALSGCGIIQELAGGGGDDVFDLQVGDCLADTIGTEVSSVETLDCNEPHYYEVYSSIIMEDGAFPGDSAVSTTAEDECVADFESFIGVEYAYSEIWMESLRPTQETWDNMDDREILCMVYDPDGDTIGTLANANR
ncbi:septum formation family protein [Spiractinospora alimapuensis]|uniref:septum formation family protein n=1 Tax=Spiractinospora alimapuensis TaxID=2820884 RepID=UPI001F429D8B|nr:septum formation family protein [Spiractinospora alimapuensis]QVQ53310.1 septum formation family protein [Spiractinospora alimapuensis]